MRLWKYVSSARIDVLKTGLIRFAPPALTNDPFEAFPAIAQHLRMAARQYTTSSKDHISSSNSHVTEEFEQLAPELDELLGRIRLKEYGMLCLCAEAAHPLMWAHYAENHEGFAIEFDSDHPFFGRKNSDGVINRITPVEYVGERAPWDLSEDGLLRSLFIKHAA